jgi:beta-lactamase regulating signal transducer with metallopeptidase domain
MTPVLITPVLDALIEMNIAAAAAIIFLLAVRKPARRIFGPHAIYLLWAIVPIAAAATFIPSRTIEMLSMGLTLDEVIALTTPPAANSALEAMLPYTFLAAWLIGAIATAVALIRRQAAFMRDAELGLAGPAIVGFSQPRIVTPDDFSRRFNTTERKLILTHEQVHLERNDARINALVAVVRCLFWFNPVIHIGAKAMRVDQELSCDAEVIDRRPRVRRAYAETLLKTQLASRPPAGRLLLAR